MTITLHEHVYISLMKPCLTQKNVRKIPPLKTNIIPSPKLHAILQFRLVFPLKKSMTENPLR